MQKLYLVYNPRSSRAGRIEEEVLAPARELAGYMVGKFVVKKGPIVENAGRLARLLDDGDVVVTAGGDGTTEVGVNAAMLSGKDVKLLALPYGNFNDVARMFGAKGLADLEGAKVMQAYPLEARVNGEFYQYTMGYFTVGMFAQATEVFEKRQVRGALKKQGGGLVFSIWNLAKWYFKNRAGAVLPEFTLDGARQAKVTDILAVNGRTAAKVMRGGEYYTDGKQFLLGTGRLKSLLRLMIFMLKSMTRRVPGAEVAAAKVEFARPATVVLQAEGEYEKLTKVESLEFKKAGRGVKILTVGN